MRDSAGNLCRFGGDAGTGRIVSLCSVPGRGSKAEKHAQKIQKKLSNTRQGHCSIFS